MADLKEHVALEVGGDAISWADVSNYMRIRRRFELFREIADLHLCLKEARKEGLEISDPELQEGADHFRLSLGLHEAQKTMAWLERNRMTVDDMEQVVEESLLVEKLKDKLAGGKIEPYFAENKIRFDQVELSHIVVKDEGMARELLAQVSEEDADFEALARQYSIDARTARAGGYIGTAYRKELSPAVEAAAFGAKDGEKVGPVKTDMGHHILFVHRIKRAELGDTSRAAIREILFHQWLADRRKQAEPTFHA
jgi:parvulin-like peptidyl-prolyl isomerase